MNETTKLGAPSGVGGDALSRFFSSLRNAAETAIADAKTIKCDFDAYINWDDMRCVRVFHWVDESGYSGFTVDIEGASPDDVDFCRWIAESIKEDTGIDAEVVAEW